MKTTKLLLVGLLLALVFPFELAAQLATQQPDAIATLISFGGAAATSLLLGATKSLDNRLTSSRGFRKAQPLIVLGGALLAPLIASKTGMQIDPQAFAAAPAATFAVIAARELLTLLQPKRR